jgi:hypothetical protein
VVSADGFSSFLSSFLTDATTGSAAALTAGSVVTFDVDASFSVVGLVSFLESSSSSESPRLNGSRSSISDLGSMLLSGCHLPLLAAPAGALGDGWRLLGALLRVFDGAIPVIWPPVASDLKRFGLAAGRGGRDGGASSSLNSSLWPKSSLNTCGSAS